MMWSPMLTIVLVLSCLLVGACGSQAQPLPEFDFTQPGVVGEWHATHDVAALAESPEGMVISITGGDPYITGPARDYPAGQPLWLQVRLKADQSGTGQIFYFANGASEENSVRFPVPAGRWHEVRLPLPPLGPGYRLRLDPPGIEGRCVVAALSFAPRVLYQAPRWPKPQAPTLGRGALRLSARDLELRHQPDRLGAFALTVKGTRMAVGWSRPQIGYLEQARPRWLDLRAARATVRQSAGAIVAQASIRDGDGATWRITQRFSPARLPGALDVETRVEVDRQRSVLFLPMVVLFPGVGSFGAKREQGVFAGLEYLDAPDTSSSEADIIGPGSKRQVPDSLKITFPLMAMQAQGRYVGLTWEMDEQFSALYDTPDRLFGSGGHVMGILYPGSDGTNREEGQLLPYDGGEMTPGQPITLRATILGGEGESIVPAVQQYVALRGLLPVPPTGLDKQAYVRLAGGGWIDSQIREGDHYRHAFWPGITSFPPGPAADAPLFMEWLAQQSVDATLAERLRRAATEARSQVTPRDYDAAGVSHVRYPAQALAWGGVADNLARVREGGHNTLRQFEPDGTLLYRKRPDAPDFGSTHFAPDANGLTSQAVVSVLQAAVYCGDAALIQEGLRLLRALDKFRNTVPRGAQTWECPLHTPDILASANLVRAYTLGYELTGDRHFLEQARYWAWTGLPFVYLVNPTGQAIGPYATIAVFGATHWKAPNWMGMPVQWCGLVYADALYRLARYDESANWKQVADGITASGIQHSWDATDPALQGLLPDSVNLRPQTRNPVAINPGTVQANAIRLYGGPEIYDYHISRPNDVVVHAPGALAEVQETPGNLSFRVRGWTDQPYHVLVVGLKGAPTVRLDGKETPLTEPHQFLAAEGQLILRVEGSPTIALTLAGR